MDIRPVSTTEPPTRRRGEESLRIVIARVFEDLFCRAFLDDPSLIHDGDRVGHGR